MNAPIHAILAPGILDSPVGPLTVVHDGQAVTGIYFRGHTPAPNPERLGTLVDAESLPEFAEIIAQFRRYFRGDITAFTFPTAPSGTAFQQSVWAALRAIPYGSTCTYSDLAVAVGNPNAVRAVAAANARNPLSIVVPCHRVIGADGTLTGYAGGLDAKQLLLELEGAAPLTLL